MARAHGLATSAGESEPNTQHQLMRLYGLGKNLFGKNLFFCLCHAMLYYCTTAAAAAAAAATATTNTTTTIRLTAFFQDNLDKPAPER